MAAARGSDTGSRRSLLRQERSRQTRTKLLRAAESLARKRPFDDVRVEDIAEEAEVSRATFYVHFDSKEAVLRELAFATTERVFAQVVADEAAADSDTLTVLEHTIDGIAKRVARNPKRMVALTVAEMYRTMAELTVRPDSSASQPRRSIRDVFSAVFARGQARGEIDSAFHPNELGMMLAILVTQAMLAWATDNAGGLSLPVLLRRHTRAFLGGVWTGRPEQVAAVFSSNSPDM